MYNIWQDAEIRTRVVAIAARCANNELHTSLTNELHTNKLDDSFFNSSSQKLETVCSNTATGKMVMMMLIMAVPIITSDMESPDNVCPRNRGLTLDKFHF